MGTRPIDRLIHWLAHWFEVQAFRDEIEHSCQHQAAGACSEACAEQVMADRW